MGRLEDESMVRIIYPLDRLLANPRIFYAIADRLNGPDGDFLRNATLELVEFDMNEEEDYEESVFRPNDVCFQDEVGDGAEVEIILSTGYTCVLTRTEENGEVTSAIQNKDQLNASAAIYSRLVKAVRESNPDLGEIVLCPPPTPGNSYLRSPSGDYFEGGFHLLEDPDKKYHFNVMIEDIQKDILTATIKPA